MQRLLLTKMLFLFAIVFLVGCGGSSTTTPAAKLTTVAISPSSATVVSGATQEFSCTGKDQNGVEMTTTLTWSISDSNLGTITSSGSKGILTATKKGTGTITCTPSEDTTLAQSASVEVTTGSLNSLVISPTSVTLKEGETQTFTVYGTDASGNAKERKNITVSPTWSVVDSSGSSCSTCVGTIDSSGKFTATKAGTGKVKAVVDSISTTADVTVTDATAPAISSVSASATSDTAATITWTTDEASTSQVKYGTSSSNLGSSTTEDTNTTTSHSVNLTGLSASTTYYYQVISKDAAGNSKSSSTGSFATLAANQTDTTVPVISSVSASASETSATVTWTTDEASTSKVNYGTSQGSLTSSTTEDTTKTTSHSVTITSLTASTTYYYQAVSKDASANSSNSSTSSFTTTAAGAGDTTAPTVTNVSISATSSGATISWTTNESSTTQVEYGPTMFMGTNTTEDTTKTTSHSATLSSLTASTQYYYAVKSKDAAGNTGSSSGTFTTSAAAGAADTTGPSISSVAISNVTDSGATITWTTDEAATTQVKYEKRDTYYNSGQTYGQQTTEVSTLSTTHSVTLSGLSSSDTTYVVQVLSKDASSNSSNAGPYEFTTLAAGVTLDTTSPELATLSPKDGSTVSGTVIINAEVKDNVSVSKCEFFVDSVSIGSSSNSDCFITWNTTTLTNGSSHTVKITATDSSGNSASVGPNTVTVNNANTASVAGTVTYSGSAAANTIVFAMSCNGGEGCGAPDGPLTTTDSSGNYTLSGITAGTWYIGAIKDVNGDGQFSCADPETIDSTQQVLAAGDAKTGINLTIAIRQNCKMKTIAVNEFTKKK